MSSPNTLVIIRYDSGYYGYIYSECQAADLFSLFEALVHDQNSIIDLELGSKYRAEILSRGATKRGNEMLKAFLGRCPSKQAFFDRIIKP